MSTDSEKEIKKFNYTDGTIKKPLIKSRGVYYNKVFKIMSASTLLEYNRENRI